MTVETWHIVVASILLYLLIMFGLNAIFKQVQSTDVLLGEENFRIAVCMLWPICLPFIIIAVIVAFLARMMK